MTSLRQRLPLLCFVFVLLSLAASAAHARHHKASANGVLDEGQLDPAYFGGPLPFHKGDDIDYLWVKEGFAIDGHSFHFVEWPEPTFLGEDHPDGDDRRLAREMTDGLPQLLQQSLGDAWNGHATTSMDKGDVRVEGRIVGCSTGNDTAKWLVGWGAGAGNTTFDLKFVDAKTGEVLAAVHHRVVSGTSWSTTGSKLLHWVDDFGEMVRSDGFAKLYQHGKLADD